MQWYLNECCQRSALRRGKGNGRSISNNVESLFSQTCLSTTLPFMQQFSQLQTLVGRAFGSLFSSNIDHEDGNGDGRKPTLCWASMLPSSTSSSNANVRSPGGHSTLSSTTKPFSSSQTSGSNMFVSGSITSCIFSTEMNSKSSQTGVVSI